ncbi:unnamed protein product [Cyprideis torosa]|uniref:Uncharacterized protein n=1 Tax=Cyprideis torosa TaxID=163714 RepID=A0A7R8W5H5_9CRUS|nr:unnamed protein product [Cyprideis torosa]CAG0880896.1 unnamed protein product [Cyprideis torosa]
MVMKIAILGVGVLATIMALTIKTIYGLWYLCADFVYVILFPQLLLVVHFQDYVNTYGSLVAYFLGIFIRMLGGEDILGLPAAVHFPWYNYETGSQRFPFRTMAMLVSMITFLVVSGVTNWLFMSGRLPPKYDYFRCIVNIPDDVQKVESPTDGELAVMNSVLGKQYNATEERNGRVNPALTLDSESEPETDIPPPPYPGVGMKSPSKVPLTKETSKF